VFSAETIAAHYNQVLSCIEYSDRDVRVTRAADVTFS
jgi:hypothetical protein